MSSVGLSSISFFGADGSTHSYIDDDGEYRYERDRPGAEFVFGIDLTRDRTVQLRVAVFDHDRPLEELESNAYDQVKRTLIALGKIGEDLKSPSERAASENKEEDKKT